MRWSVIGSASLAMGLSTAALADGIPGRQVADDTRFNWAGFYIGANAGYSWGRAGTNLIATSSTETFIFDAAGATVFDETVTRVVALGGKAEVNGWIGGGQFGYNFQSHSLVIGVEVDLQWSGEKGRNNFCSTLACGAGSTFLTASHELEWFGTARARAGVLIHPRALVYGTGGLAFGHFNSDYTAGLVAGPSGTLNDNKTANGYVLGGGTEWAIHRNLSLKAEYLYMDFGEISNARRTAFATVQTPDVPVAGSTTQVDTTVNAAVRSHFTDQIFRVGLNYKFGEPEVRPIK